MFSLEGNLFIRRVIIYLGIRRTEEVTRDYTGLHLVLLRIIEKVMTVSVNIHSLFYLTFLFFFFYPPHAHFFLCSQAALSNLLGHYTFISYYETALVVCAGYQKFFLAFGGECRQNSIK